MAPFRSTLARSVGKLLGVYKETDLSLRGDVQSTRFVSTAASPFTANIVMMGGGGGGGSYQGGGGGGAGGMAIFTFAVTIGSPYPFQVGNGGAGSPYPSNGSGGVYSYFNTDSGQKAGAGGAGGKGAAPNTPGSPAAALGGSGGGGGSNPNAVTNGASGDNAAPDPNVFGGNTGGSSTTANAGNGGNTAGGGGGVGSNGGNGGTQGGDGSAGGDGGDGKEAPSAMFPSAFMKGSNFPSTFIGLPVSLPDAGLRTFGGGGAGGAEFGYPGKGYGGPGGGGNGANVNREDITAAPGVEGRGAGGGGGGQVIDGVNDGKHGGGGVIYIQYPSLATATITVPSPRAPRANTYTTNTGDSNHYVIITADETGTTSGTIEFN
jgi:hypothetical protein